MAKRFIGEQIGAVVSPIVDVVDVDGVIQRIDINKLLERVDINTLLDRVDVDRQLHRIDFDAVLDRIDIDHLIERSNLEAIIARGSAGVCSNMLDVVYSQIVYVDQFVQRVGRLACCIQTVYLPPKPGRRQGKVPFPSSRTELAVQVQHRYCGILSRIFTYVIDFLIVVLIFTVILLLIEAVASHFKDDPDYELELFWVLLAFFGWRLVYTVSLLSVFRRTVGMSIVGIILVNSGTGSRAGFFRVVIRHLGEEVVVYTLLPLLPSMVFAWIRDDGRTPVDILTCTGLVFAWDARTAALRLGSAKTSQVSEQIWEA